MIVWSGLGFLAFLIPVAFYWGSVALANATMGAGYGATHSWPGAVGVLVSALVVWMLALKLNGPGRTLVDPATGQQVTLRRRHTLFWIPMQYVAIVIGVIALGILFYHPAATP